MIDRKGDRRPPGQFKIHGIYGRVLCEGKSLFTNDPASETDRIGLPPGHPPLESFLGVPLQHEGRTIGMIAVGNREGGYGHEELEILEALAPAVVEAFLRKRAEESLRTTLQRFYTVLSNMHNGILLVTDEGRVEYANQVFCDYVELQCSPADLRQLTSNEVIEQIRNAFRNPDEAIARIREIVGRGQPVIGEEVAARDGRTYLRDYIPLSVDGKSYGRLWHHWDITKMKRTEEALRESEGP